MLAKIAAPAEYDAFHPAENARLALNFLVGMTDAALGHLPYTIFAPMHDTPYAEHTRADDAEYAAQWYEGVSCAREVCGAETGAEVENALLERLLNEGWDEASGLRFPMRRPWSGDLDYAVLSELATVLSALNRAIECGRGGDLAARRALGLAHGLRRAATERKARSLPFGEVGLDYPCHSFAADVYVKGAGFNPAVSTGYSDSVLRYSALIHPLTRLHILTEDAQALELASGLANRIVNLSHLLSARAEFSGSAHAALLTAAGLLRLGRLLGNDKYTLVGKGVYDFVRRNTSAFGWVPEYSNWQLPAEERSSGCVVSTMIRCAIELADNGFAEYLDDAHRFWRNHLEEAQVTDVSFLPKAAHPPKDTAARTYRDLPERLLGAISGYTAVNCIQLTRYHALAACCSACGAAAMLAAWRRTTTASGRDGLIVNFPVNYEGAAVKVEVGYPNTGFVRATLIRPAKVSIRVFPWMGSYFEGRVNGRPAPFERHDDFITFEALPAGASVEISHPLKTRRVMENVMGMDFFGVWRGPDMVDVLPHGFAVRLYQRIAGQPKEVPDGFGANRSRHDVEPVAEPSARREKRLLRRRPAKI